MVGHLHSAAYNNLENRLPSFSKKPWQNLFAILIDLNLLALTLECLPFFKRGQLPASWHLSVAIVVMFVAHLLPVFPLGHTTHIK